MLQTAAWRSVQDVTNTVFYAEIGQLMMRQPLVRRSPFAVVKGWMGLARSVRTHDRLSWH